MVGDKVVLDGGEILLDTTLDGSDFGVFYQVSGETHETYAGPYEVYPAFADIVLPTNDKIMTDDVTVYAIAVARVDNPQGGKTITIGG